VLPITVWTYRKIVKESHEKRPSNEVDGRYFGRQLSFKNKCWGERRKPGKRMADVDRKGLVRRGAQREDLLGENKVDLMTSSSEGGSRKLAESSAKR